MTKTKKKYHRPRHDVPASTITGTLGVAMTVVAFVSLFVEIATNRFLSSSIGFPFYMSVWLSVGMLVLAVVGRRARSKFWLVPAIGTVVWWAIALVAYG